MVVNIISSTSVTNKKCMKNKFLKVVSSVQKYALVALGMVVPFVAQPVGATGLDTLISDASTSFSTTTGFAFADLVTWAGDILKQILGGGLGLVDALIGWIIALIIISVIIKLIFHGMKWLHIVR